MRILFSHLLSISLTVAAPVTTVLDSFQSGAADSLDVPNSHEPVRVLVSRPLEPHISSGSWSGASAVTKDFSSWQKDDYDEDIAKPEPLGDLILIPEPSHSSNVEFVPEIAMDEHEHTHEFKHCRGRLSRVHLYVGHLTDIAQLVLSIVPAWVMLVLIIVLYTVASFPFSDRIAETSKLSEPLNCGTSEPLYRIKDEKCAPKDESV